MANLNLNTVLWNATTLTHPVTDNATENMHGKRIDSLAIYHWINFIVISIIGIVGKSEQFYHRKRSGNLEFSYCYLISCDAILTSAAPSSFIC